MRALARHAFSRGGVILGLTLTALACLPASLRLAAPDAALTVLLPVTLLGVAFGFLAYAPELSRTRLAWFVALLGPLLLFIRLGQLVTALAAAFGETLRLLGLLLLPSQDLAGSLAEFARWLDLQRELWVEVTAFGGRLITWMAALLRGTPFFDLPARALWLSAGLWLLAGWASWRIRRRNDPLGGLLPTTILIAIALDTSVQDRWPLWLHLAALLVLLAVMHISVLLSQWHIERRDFSDSIGEDTLIGSVVMIILLLVMAYAASIFSVKDILDKLRERQNPPTSTSVASGGTGKGSGGVRSGADTVLQAAHIITAGPVLSDDFVMAISTGDLPPMQHATGIQPPRYDWRGATYQAYTGAGWRNPVGEAGELPPATDLISTDAAGFRLIHGTVRLPGGAGSVAYWTGTLVQAGVPLEILWRSRPLAGPLNSMPGALANGDMIGAQITTAQTVPAYQFTSLVQDASETELRAAPATYPDWVTARYLQLPESVPERVRGLARDITARASTPYDQALAIETYLRRIPYSLDVPAPPTGRDAADYFLFDLKKGYCDYYATSMAVLARASGLPARLVTGFASGSYNPLAAEYVITNADAHAWPEIYFAGIGWVEFEPTPSQPAPRREGSVGGAAAPHAESTQPKAWNILPGFDPRALTPLLWSLPLLGALFGAWLAIDGLRLRQLDPDDSTQRVYRRLRRGTRRLHGVPAMGETAHEYSLALTSHLETLSGRRQLLKWCVKPIMRSIHELTGLYSASLFAPTPIRKAEGRRAVRLWEAIRWRLFLVNLALTIMRYSPAAESAPSIAPEPQAE